MIEGTQSPGDGPFALDTRYLTTEWWQFRARHLQGGMLERSSELVRFFGDWMARYRPTGGAARALEKYLDVYGRFSPIVLIALPSALPAYLFFRYVKEFELGPTLATGRFIIFDVRPDDEFPSFFLDREERRLRTWKDNLFGSHYYPKPLNRSPIDRERFLALMDFTDRRFKSLLSGWSRRSRRGDATAVDRERNTAAQFTASKGAPYHFVSYSRADSERVDGVCAALRARGAELWLDRTSIVGGEEFLRRLVEGLTGCAGVLPFCSKSFSESLWTRREMLFAIDEKKPIVPAWMSNPALFAEMKLLLNVYQAVMIAGASHEDAAVRIAAALLRPTPPSDPHFGFSW